jgi:hypothetical protein
MISFTDLIQPLFNYDREFHPEYKLMLDGFYKSSSCIKVVSKEHGLFGEIGHLHESKGTLEAVYYIADQKLIRDSEDRCPRPFQFIPDCNYMYYGCYLSLAAYLSRKPITHITLYHPVDNNERYVLKYRPEIARMLLDYKLVQEANQNGQKKATQLSF